MHFISERIIQAVCWTLLHSLWQGLLVALATGLVMVLSKKSTAAVRYNLLSCLFMVFIAFVAGTFYLEMGKPAGQLLYGNLPVVQTAESNFTTGATAAGHVWSLNLENFAAYFNTHAALIVAIWFVVFMARCLKILSGLVHVQRLLHYKTQAPSAYWEERVRELATQLQIRRVVYLLESALINVPVVVGFLKPTILVPLGLLANLSPGQVESILMHELAHIRRKDYFFNLIQRFADMLFFFNPAVWWLSSLIRSERENCCDDVAIAQVKSKKQFVQALVSFYEYKNNGSPYVMQFAGRKHRLVNRVKRIVYDHNQTLNPLEKIMLSGSLLACCFTFFTVGAREPILGKQAIQPLRGNVTRSFIAYPSQTRMATIPVQRKRAIAAVVPQHFVKISPVHRDELNDTGIETASTPFQANVQVAVHFAAPSELGKNEEESDFASIGYTGLAEKELMLLQQHGVDVDFITQFNRLGYTNIPLDEVIVLKDHGVTAELISGFRQLGYASVPLATAIDLKDHGVDPGFVRGLLSLGYKNITLSAAQELRDHGVDAAFISGFNALGYTQIPLNQAQALRDHGVGVHFLKKVMELGVKNLSLNNAIAWTDHGITADFIAYVIKKTGVADHSPEEYIALKDRS